MAFQKDFSSDYGVSCSYWKITELHFNLDGTIKVILHGFADKATRLQELNPLRVLVYVLPQGTLTEYSLSEIYQYLKTLPDFSMGDIVDI